MKRTLSALSAGLGLLLASAVWVSAATSTWTGGGSDAYWTNAANWTAGVPGSGDDILFPDVANQIVDLTDASPTIGTSTFNAADDYTLQTGALTLGGDITQSGAGAVTFASVIPGDMTVDLGGASRTFGGSGAGAVRFETPLTDVAGGGVNNLLVNGGNYALASADNGFNQLTVSTGAVVTLSGATAMNPAGLTSYLGLADYVNVDGGILKDSRSDSANVDPPTLAAGTWTSSRHLYFGPGGGALMYLDYPPVGSSSLGASADWAGGPRLYTTDATNGIPGTIVLGQPGSFFTGNNHRYCLTLREAVLGNGDINVVVTNMAYLGLMATNMAGKLTFYGLPGGSSSDLSNNVGGVIIGNIPSSGLYGYQRAFLNLSGMFINGAVFFWERHSERAYLATDITLEPGASADFCGGTTGNNRWMNLGYPTNELVQPDLSVFGLTNKITIRNGAAANMNLQLRSDMLSRGIRIFSKIEIQSGGTLKFYRSHNTGDSYVIETFWPITGMGSASGEARVIVDLPYASPSLGSFTGANGASGTNGVNFDGIAPALGSYPGGQLVVNGSTVYGLRVQGYSEFVTNLLSAARLNALAGSGGVLTIAITNNDAYTVDNGPTSASSVALGFDSQDGSAPEYVVAANTLVTNFQRLVVKGGRVTLPDGLVMAKNLRLLGGTVAIPDGATVTLAQLVFSTNATIEMGAAAGAATTLNFANSAGTIGNWFAGQVLTVKDWNGSVYGGGPDRIFVGADATGLTASQLAQIKWLNPFGSGDVVGAYQLATGEIVPAVGQSAVSNPSGGGATDFQFNVSGTAGRAYVVERTLDLTPAIVWTPVATNPAPFLFMDAGSAGAPVRFYRVRAQ